MSKTCRSDGTITRAKILEAAGTLIAKQGYAQTTNKEIASLAEVDLAAINYHFNGRDGLYLAVLSEANKRHMDVDKLTALAASDGTPDEKLEVLLGMCISRLNQPEDWHGRVYIQELLSPSSLFTDFMQTEGLAKRQAMRQIISQIAGIAEDDPQIYPCLLSIIGPCMMLMVVAKFGCCNVNDLEWSLDSSQLIAHLKQFSLAGLSSLQQKA